MSQVDFVTYLLPALFIYKDYLLCFIENKLSTSGFL